MEEIQQSKLSTELQQYRKQGRLVFGVKQASQLMRQGAAERVYLASNCPKGVKEQIEQYGKLSGTVIDRLDMPSDELGVVCKRQHTVLVLCLRKA